MSVVAFEYRAVDKSGASRQGVAHALNKGEVFRKLSAAGLTPLKIRPASSRIGGAVASSRRVKAKDLAHFTYQLGVLVSARIPISEGLIGIAQQERPGALRDIITDVAKRIESGEQVAGAMEAHREALGEVYVETVRAAEKSGNLAKVLDHLSDMLERSLETSAMVRSAFMYPACVTGVLGMAIVFLVAFVVPRFARMFQQRGVSLPFFTQLLLRLGTSFEDYWYVYLLGVVAAAVAVRLVCRTATGLSLVDYVAHRIPYINKILVGATLSRFTRIFGLSLSSGLGLIDSLELAGRATARPMLMKDIHKMVGQVRSGGRLMDVLKSCTYFTPFAVRMLTAGEQSAEVPKMCSIISRHYDREVGHLTKNIGTFIEPILIVAIAGVVLVVALAIFMPMWDMVKLVT